MKLSIIPFVLSFSFFMIYVPTCAQQEQSIAHGGIHMKIPSDWFYQTQDYPNGNKSINSGKKGEQNSFTINKVNSDLSTREGLDLTKQMLGSNEFLGNAPFSKYKDGRFNGYPSSETSFTLNFQENHFYGKIISFKSGQKIYVVMYMGDQAYYSGKLLQEILNSVQVE